MRRKGDVCVIGIFLSVEEAQEDLKGADEGGGE